MLQLMKSLLFHKPEAWEKHPFRAEQFIIGSFPPLSLSGVFPLPVHPYTGSFDMYFSVLFRVQSRRFNELFPVSRNLVLLMTYLLFSLNEGRAEKRVLWNDASSPTREIWSSSQKQGWRQGLLSGRKGEIRVMRKLSIARGLGLLRTLTSIERFHSRGQQNKRKVLHKKRVQLPQDWLEHQHGLCFIVLGHQ